MSNLLKETVAWFLSWCRRGGGERRWVALVLMAGSKTLPGNVHVVKLGSRGKQCVNMSRNHFLVWCLNKSNLLFLIITLCGHQRELSRDKIVCFVASYLVDMLLSASMQVSRFLQIQNTSKSFPSLLSAVLHVFTRLIVSRLGWRSSFLLQRFLTRGTVPYFLIYLFIYFQKEKCWSERDIDRSWARRGLWLSHLKVIFLPTAASPPPWLGWVLKIAHWGRYPNPTVTMSAIKNSWLCNVKHGKGQWDNTGHGCEGSAGHHLWSWYIEKYLSL